MGATARRLADDLVGRRACRDEDTPRAATRRPSQHCGDRIGFRRFRPGTRLLRKTPAFRCRIEPEHFTSEADENAHRQLADQAEPHHHYPVTRLQ